MAATAQGPLTAATSLARVAGALLSGWPFDWLGPRRIYLVMGFLVLAALILFSTSTLDRNWKPNNN